MLILKRYEPPRKSLCQHAPATLETLHGTRTNTKYAQVAEQAAYSARKRGKLGDGKVGFLSNDKRLVCHIDKSNIQTRHENKQSWNERVPRSGGFAQVP